ncbi:CaiB/BaiF CoA-transferase family protein [Afifella sp. IM 167]|uniref:CaiB/BaiF CoA transferase family protein n=1 Tax=Afifella sp. IM 167 TaxID=2033586 RepID=UPI001CCA4573|nr:CoA transferase [Afifella sp. IM 167]MBZ8134802.1 CoA transferase [Afifella sp. IM 167]
MTTPTGPLAGVRIVDLTQMLAGPFCTMLLADQGAEIIKIEPIGGEYIRFGAPFRPDDTMRVFTGYFASINRNKKSIAIDLKKPEGRELVLRLCREADALVENYRVGVMDRLGLSYETLREVNPRLVYASIRGFGDPRTGRSPHVEWTAYDVVAQAMGGVMGINGAEAGRPLKVGPGIGDTVPGTMAAFGVVCAILQARQSGKGQYVDVAMVDAILSVCERIVAQYSVTGVVPRPEGNRHPMFAPFGMLPAKDGWITVAGHTDRLWGILCTQLDRPELITDPRSATREARVENQAFVYDEIGRTTGAMTKHELAARLGGRLPFGTVNDVEDILDDDHFRTREMIVDVEHPGCAAPLQIAGNAIRMTETPGGVRSRAPMLGEHTDDILAGIGCSPEEIAALRQGQTVE